MSGVRKAVAAVLHGAALTLSLAGAAHAQQAADQGSTGQSSATGGVQALEEITVTGSRIKRTTDFDTPNPTTVVDSSYLQNLGIVNVGQAVTQLPSNISTNTPTTTGNSSFFTGSTIANLRGLNPYFGSRTLTLVNTRRYVPTNQGDGVDLNFIPSILIDRIDTVTGGASAAYGSGAIAGVQNIFLNTRLEGGRADIDYQQSMHSDAKDKHVALAFGHGFADDRGHFVLGGEYEDMDSVGCLDARDFCSRNAGFFQNPGSPGSYLYGENLRKNMISDTGVLQNVFSGTNSLYQSNAAGTGAAVFNLGLAPYAAAGSPQNVVPGGDGDPIYKYTNLRAPVDRKVAAGTFTFALTDTLNLSVDASYGRVETTNYTAGVDSSFVAVTPANPFAAPILADAGNAPFALVAKSWNQQIDSFTRFTTTVKRASIGLDGKFGDSSWSWDGYYQIGRTNRRQLLNDNLHNNAATLALNVVSDPVTGDPVCAAKLDPTNPQYALFDPALIQACVPVSVFGTQALTPAQHAYLFGNLDERLIYTQQVAAVNASGTLFEGWGAGEIQAAVGYEHRDELGHNLEPNEPAYVRTDYLIQYGEPFSGDVKVDEAYVETSIPVLKDLAFAKKVNFDLALRESKYRNQGLAGTTGLHKTHNLTTWKISGLWDVVDTFRFRGSQSRDSRAGNFRELYYGQKIGAGGLFGYCGATGSPFQTDPCNWSLEGNPDLRPEKSDTTTFGFVWSPEGALSGLQLSVDYFRIKIKDAIQQANVQDVEDGCRDRNDPADCALITFDGTTYDVVQPDGSVRTFQGIDTVRALSFNGAAYMFKGLDFSGSYNMQLSNGANLSFRLLAENMWHQVFQNNPRTAPVDIVGQTGSSNSFLNDNQPQPKWTGSLIGTYAQGPASVTMQMRFVGRGTMDYNNRDGGLNNLGDPVIPVTTVASYQVFTLSGTYSFENLGSVSNLQLFGVVDNLFDKQPPFAAGITAFGVANNFGGTNATYFDTLGRMYRIGLRMKF
ncbi:MAG TPA: TonB-dependent receptor [Steroidobacteraceae bacterium]|jgi:iron complex outermembrane receptor protein|nr:TonB-dependent receptor [Steroidobacteraceae bacterium]